MEVAMAPRREPLREDPGMRAILDWRKLFGAFLLFGVSLCGVMIGQEVWAQSFYEGKTVRVVVFGTAGGANDLWARLLGRYMPKHIPGTPAFMVQNMPGAAGMIAANHLYAVAKPDGLTIGLIAPALYQAQIVGRPEVKFNWANFGWIGTGEKSAYQVYIRTDTGYKELDDIKRATEPPRCAETAIGSMNYAYIRLIDEVFQAKFNPVLGYKGGGEMNLAIERGEAVCRATTVSAVLTTEPPLRWLKTGFIRVLVQSGKQRHPALSDVPTIWELADKHAVGEEDRQLIRLVVAAAEFGRPFVAPPGFPKIQLALVREAFLKTMRDPEFLKEAAKAGLEVNSTGGEDLERLAREIVAVSLSTVQRLKNLLE